MIEEPKTPYEWALHYYEQARRECLIARKDRSPRNRYARELAAEQCLIQKGNLYRLFPHGKPAH